MRRYWSFVRPFTLLVPAGGMLAGALMALGAAPKWSSDWAVDQPGLILNITLGAFLAASLNVFSNGINQIFDLEVDRINKPHRMLPSGRMTTQEAWVVSVVAWLATLLAAGAINRQCLAVVIIASVLTWIYSAPPLRTKSRGGWANLTIAIPRGTLLLVCGWSTVKTVLQPEPWIVGGIFGLYFLGAASTKDFSDMAGDRAGNCRTLPLIWGPERAVRLIAPFFVFPFLGILPAAWTGLLKANFWILALLGLLLPTWGWYIAHLLVTRLDHLVSPGEASYSENHPSWKHMYLLTIVAQLGFAMAYLLS